MDYFPKGKSVHIDKSRVIEGDTQKEIDRRMADYKKVINDFFADFKGQPVLLAMPTVDENNKVTGKRSVIVGVGGPDAITALAEAVFKTVDELKDVIERNI